MTSIFDGDDEIAPKIFLCFFNRKLIFVLKQTFIEKKYFACKI